MILFKFRTTTCVTSCNFANANSPRIASTKDGRAREARLHTATSSGAEYSTISVQRLELRMVPRFCWLLLRLHESLYSMNGPPVSVWASRIEYQSFCALIVFRPRPSLSYLENGCQYWPNVGIGVLL